MSVIQFGWKSERTGEGEHPEFSTSMEVVKLPVYPGMEEEVSWLEAVDRRAQKGPFSLATHGALTFDEECFKEYDEGWTVVVSRQDWKALSVDSKLRLFGSFNVMIPRDASDTVWEDVEGWDSLEALEQHVPLHTQHCVHGE